MLVWGSAQLVRTLVAADVVDEYRLMIEPILLGGGKRIFPNDGVARTLTLEGVTPSSTGVLIATSHPATHQQRLCEGQLAPSLIQTAAEERRHLTSCDQVVGAEQAAVGATAQGDASIGDGVDTP